MRTSYHARLSPLPPTPSPLQTTLTLCSGYVFFDCVQYATESSNVEICPIANSSWATCDPLSRAAPTVFDASVTLARTARGRVNQLCHVDPADNANENQGCLEDLVCVPLPQLVRF